MIAIYSKKLDKQLFLQFIRFCIVGVICTIIDAAIYYSVLTFASYRVALIAGYLLSLIVNYFLTIYWTFQTRPSKSNALGVVFAHLLNLFVVRMGLMYLFVSIIGLTERIAYLPTLAISMITNFIILRLIIKYTR